MLPTEASLLPAPSSFQGPQVFLGSWPHHSGLLVASSSSCCVYSFVSSKGSVLGFRAHLGQPVGLHPETLSYLCENSFCKQGHIHRVWGLGLGHIILGPPFNPLHHLRRKSLRGFPAHLTFFPVYLEGEKRKVENWGRRRRRLPGCPLVSVLLTCSSGTL